MGTSCNYCPGNYPVEQVILNKQINEETQEVIDKFRNEHKNNVKSTKHYQEGPGRIFRGNLINGQKNGYGEYFNNDNIYIGYWKNDRPHGEGILVKEFGEYIEGHFSNGIVFGKVHEKLNDSEFTGEYENGKRSSGTLQTSEFKYNGSFSENKFSGFGIIEFTNGDRFEGYFKNGLYHGSGKYQTKGLGVYEGEFKNGQYDGKGIFKWKNDYYYQGEYENGVRHGYGKFVKGNDEHEGYWVEGQPQINSKFINHDEFKEIQSQKAIRT